MDVDGTLTDGKIYMGVDGEVLKTINIKDGYGIHDILPKIGITPIIITGRKSQIVLNRCRELAIQDVFQGVDNKCKVLLDYLHERGALLSQVAYIGDDLNDIECMKMIHDDGGITAAPFDAEPSVCHIVNYVSRYKGGEGAVRDFINWIVEENYPFYESGSNR